MAKLLSTSLSTQVLHFRPGRSPQTFVVTVRNQSTEFASFQLELLAAGVEPGSSTQWYRQTPDLSAKIPPGDRTQFAIDLLEVPPVPGGFVGSMNLTVRVFSVELREEDRQVLTLVVEGSSLVPPRLDLLTPTPSVTPPQTLELPIRLGNPNRSPLAVQLSVRGLPLEWLPDGHERRLEVLPQGDALVVFICKLDTPAIAPSRAYPFEIEARVSAMVSSRTEGRLTVLPAGSVAFALETPQITYPATSADPLTKAKGEAIARLRFHNHSNLDQALTPVLERVRRPLGAAPSPAPAVATDQPLPEPSAVPIGATVELAQPIPVRRPWLGWPRAHTYHINVLRPDEQIPLDPPRQTLTVRVLPRLPGWVQLLGLGLLAVLLWWVREPAGHRAAVNMVQFDGRASEVLSASKDQTVRQWRVNGQRLRGLGRLVRGNKAVRVVRYRPVGNDAIAIGYENGAAELRSLRVDQPPVPLPHDLDDRVFDLQFTPDSRYLFAGYGSGAVQQWDVSGFARGEVVGVQTQQVDFAVQTLALLGQDASRVALGGRFNRLVLWDWQQNTFTPIAYPSGGNLDYITSLATADAIPSLLAIADNQGRIGLWDIRACLDGGTCRPLDDWQDGHGGQGVQSVALSEDGCYLASGGMDGKTYLWTLEANGEMQEGQELGRSRQPIDTVDIIRQGDRLLVVAGGSNHRIQLYSVPNTPSCRS